jgi:hypothetical protein
LGEKVGIFRNLQYIVGILAAKIGKLLMGATINGVCQNEHQPCLHLLYTAKQLKVPVSTAWQCRHFFILEPIKEVVKARHSLL